MNRRFLFLAALMLGSLAVGPLVDVAEACPMCKAANEANDALPRAYMYSILFMLAVPASVLTGFGIGFYRLSKQQPSTPDTGILDDDQLDRSLDESHSPADDESRDR